MLRSVFLCACLLVSSAFAQSPDAPKMKYEGLYGAQPPVPATIVFSGIGSFKAEGMGNFACTVDGTVLLHGVEAKLLVISPGLKLEYGPDTRIEGGKSVTRVCYHGKGTIKIVEGRIQAIIFFGDKCSGRFDGVGRFRFSGDGTFSVKYDRNNPGKPSPWYESGVDTYVPSIPPMKPPAGAKTLPTVPQGKDEHSH